MDKIKYSFSCSPLFSFIYLFQNKLTDVPEYAMMQFHMMMLLDDLGKIALVDKIFYPRVKSQIYLSSVQENVGTT